VTAAGRGSGAFASTPCPARSLARGPSSLAVERTFERTDADITAGGVRFAYRQLGPSTGVPVVFLARLAAVLDYWDPRVIDGIAAKRRVITFDHRGIGAPSGSVPHTVEQMARDAVTSIRTLGLEQVDLFGFSLGGGVSHLAMEEDFLARLKERTEDRDKRSTRLVMRAQLRAIRVFGTRAPHDLSQIVSRSSWPAATTT
jgi:alpha/beta hydrolase fold